jgi:hypothetical protein
VAPDHFQEPVQLINLQSEQFLTLTNNPVNYVQRKESKKKNQIKDISPVFNKTIDKQIAIEYSINQNICENQ